LAALLGLIPWNLWTAGGWWDHRVPLIAAVALLYAGMRRRTVPAGSRNYVAPAYSWMGRTTRNTRLARSLAVEIGLNQRSAGRVPSVVKRLYFVDHFDSMEPGVENERLIGACFGALLDQPKSSWIRFSRR
jgi:hypothetical protein